MFSDRYCYVPRELSPISGRRENLFWPVYAWRVLYPDDRQQPGCNLFQETLLGLMLAGVTDKLTAHDLSTLDMRGVDTIDEWLTRLDEAGMFVFHSTGT